MCTPSQSPGFSLLEVLITISIMAILVTLTVPSFRDFIERNEVIAAAEALSADLRWARGEALKRGADVRVIFTPGTGSAWRYDIRVEEAVPTIIKSVISAEIADFSKLELAASFGSYNDTLFDHIRGTTEGQNGTATFTSARGSYNFKVILSTLGRVRICSVDYKIGGYAQC